MLYVRYHFTPIKLAELLKAQQISVDKDVKQWKLFSNAGKIQRLLLDKHPEKPALIPKDFFKQHLFIYYFFPFIS